MGSTHPALVDTHRPGPKTREWVVRAKECPAFTLHNIAHVGVAEARFPYAMVRTDLPGGYFLACFSGEGRILLDGRWRKCGAGQACLAPAHVLHAFHAVQGQPWGFAWVRYTEQAGAGPLGAASAPVLAQFNGEALQHAVLGIRAELSSGQHPAALHHWAELLHGYVVRFAQPWHIEDRLSQLWEAVATRPAAGWTLTEMAQRAHCSGEHLRRLCRKQLGRSPMQHVTYLRFRHAANLLTETDLKLEAIAAEIGYANAFVFSNSFKKWTGRRPSDYRTQKPANPPTPARPSARVGGG